MMQEYLEYQMTIECNWGAREQWTWLVRVAIVQQLVVLVIQEHAVSLV